MLAEVEYNAEPSRCLEGFYFLPRLVVFTGLGDFADLKAECILYS